MSGQLNDDPRLLRSLLDRACNLAREHSVPSVMIGLAGANGDRTFPEFIVYLQSALRVEDAIFRMTRDRAVLHVADLGPAKAEEVLARLTSDFCEEYPALTPPEFDVRYFEVKSDSEELRVKDMLTEIFTRKTLH